MIYSIDWFISGGRASGMRSELFRLRVSEERIRSGWRHLLNLLQARRASTHQRQRQDVSSSRVMRTWTSSSLTPTRTCPLIRTEPHTWVFWGVWKSVIVLSHPFTGISYVCGGSLFLTWFCYFCLCPTVIRNGQRPNTDDQADQVMMNQRIGDFFHFPALFSERRLVEYSIGELVCPSVSDWPRPPSPALLLSGSGRGLGSSSPRTTWSATRSKSDSASSVTRTSYGEDGGPAWACLRIPSQKGPPRDQRTPTGGEWYGE